jgi:sulfate adenylyltransferase
VEEVTMSNSRLISPLGGALVDLIVPEAARPELRARAKRLPSVHVPERAAYDLELLATGGFSPLERFMPRADLSRVLEEMRLASGQLFPIPVILPIERTAAVKLDRDVALRDARNELLGIMTVEEAYDWDRAAMAQHVLGTRDVRHPLVAEMQGWGDVALSGRLQILALPERHDFRELRLTPAETRAWLDDLGAANVVAFQTRNPLHRAHEELTKRAAAAVGGILLLHPVVGMTKPGDVDYYTRVRSYKVLVDRYYERGRVLLALLPLAMRMAGPREAVWHALIRRNYGAGHFIVGRDHASPGLDSAGKPFYGALDAQELVARHQAELGIEMLPFGEMMYLPDEDRYEEVSRISRTTRTASISGTQVREDFLSAGRKLPAWFTRPEVAEILMDTYPPRHRQGVCVWLTGLSGAGKSTTAEILTMLLLERGRQITVLDGDVVRTHLSKGLGFSKEDRDTNIRRIGFVAAEIVRHGGAVVAAAVSPYRDTRDEVRHMVGADHFVEVFVDTPLEICERRDSKGVYAKARSGEITGFTGIDDPYEAPEAPDIVLDTVVFTPQQNARRVLEYLERQGFVRSSA